jgi:hypothetical protein
LLTGAIIRAIPVLCIDLDTWVYEFDFTPVFTILRWGKIDNLKEGKINTGTVFGQIYTPLFGSFLGILVWLKKIFRTETLYVPT